MSDGGPPGRGRVIGAVAVGGVLGSEARYLLGVAFAQTPGTWPWTTFWINVTGCLLIGVLYTALTERTPPHPLVRPLLGVGVLGGYTTFSTFSVETVGLVDAGRPLLAVTYALVTPLAAVLACAAGAGLTRRVAS
jgi:fluoride exporter